MPTLTTLSLSVSPLRPFLPSLHGERLACGGVIFILALAVFYLMIRIRRLSRRVSALHDQARVDSLTGLGNRRKLDEELEVMTDEVRRYRMRYSIAILDLDHFKTINDRFGHLAGDRLLQQVADILRRQCRRSDRTYRYGGDEFVIVFTQQRAADVGIALERIRTAIAALTLPGETDGEFQPSLSIGVAECDGDASASQEVLRQADEALFRAKRLGRNRAVTAALTLTDPQALFR